MKELLAVIGLAIVIILGLYFGINAIVDSSNEKNCATASLSISGSITQMGPGPMGSRYCYIKVQIADGKSIWVSYETIKQSMFDQPILP